MDKYVLKVKNKAYDCYLKEDGNFGGLLEAKIYDGKPELDSFMEKTFEVVNYYKLVGLIKGE